MSNQSRLRQQRRLRDGKGKIGMVATVAGTVTMTVIVVYAVKISRMGCTLRDVPCWEVIKLHDAMESFKEKFGVLPPSTTDERSISRFTNKAFPTASQTALSTLPHKLDASEALVFWLSRVSTDAKDPFAADAKERYTFFRFPASRVRDGRFYPPSDGETDPYVYFRYEDYDRAEYKGFRPYYRSEGEDWRHREYFAPFTCQIVGPGPDGKLGRGGLITELSEADRDNVVSFDMRPVGEIELVR